MNIDDDSSAKIDAQPSTAENDSLTLSQDDDDSSAKTDAQPSTAETDSMTFSQDLSQTSSWSTDEKKGEILLDDVNTALSLLSNGKISPLKYQVRTDIASLHPSSKRMLKRKATTAIEALMDCLAPGQASELTELIKMEKQVSPVPDLTTTIVKLYNNTNDFNMKKQMLSILAKDYTKKQLQEMIPGLTVYSIDRHDYMLQCMEKVHKFQNKSSNTVKDFHSGRLLMPWISSSILYFIRSAHMEPKK
ncbi:uncharacterized protein LOC127720683 [Mytilus californianus]|uniref:uncharacterized protein LOC127720683 n=1 Tax=Mytilus californianus TaxID=6549 RepID=UPI0022453050|nr:uncharacterized protein LOC127720683 [Mytilus californianus]